MARTQEQRREQTQLAVLTATVESLVDVGYSKTTTLEVQRRAGVSRGALLHHFPSKAELISATVHHLAELRGHELRDLAARLPDGAARVDAVIDHLWQSFRGPLFCVTAELRSAARTDVELRDVLAKVEAEVRDRILEQARRLFGEPVASAPGFECAMDMTLQLMVGAASTAILHGDNKRVVALINRWKKLFPQLLEHRQ
jgi:AcrR family transcriptional regulator